MKCQFIKENGFQCKAAALKGGDFCIIHSNPENAKVMGKAGGEVTQFKGVEIKVDLSTPGAILETRQKISQAILDGNLPSKIGTASIYALNQSEKILELHHIAERIQKIEKLLQG